MGAFIFRLFLIILFIVLIRVLKLTEKTDGKTLIKAILIGVGFVLAEFALEALAGLIFKLTGAILALYVPAAFVFNILSVLMLFFAIWCVADTFGVLKVNAAIYAILAIVLVVSVVMNIYVSYSMYMLFRNLGNMSLVEVLAWDVNYSRLEVIRSFIDLIPGIALEVYCLVKGKRAGGADNS